MEDEPSSTVGADPPSAPLDGGGTRMDAGGDKDALERGSPVDIVPEQPLMAHDWSSLEDYLSSRGGDLVVQKLLNEV
jgi:hypothetical protein